MALDGLAMARCGFSKLKARKEYRSSNNSNSEATLTKRRKDQIDLDMLDINEIRRCEETLILSSALRILLKPCEKDKEYSTIQKKKR